VSQHSVGSMFVVPISPILDTYWDSSTPATIFNLEVVMPFPAKARPLLIVVVPSQLNLEDTLGSSILAPQIILRGGPRAGVWAELKYST
jgi:hypothetical protein